jgi:hypothetical protein
VIIAAVLIASLGYIQTPAEVREVKADQEIVSDLQDIQWRIEDFYLNNEVLPADLGTLYGAFDAPAATEGKLDYVYEVTGETTYKICAEFNRNVNEPRQQYRPVPMGNSVGMGNNYNWDYKAGEWCFDRVINIEFKQ